MTVQPAGVSFSAQVGQTVMAAALAAGYRWPTICGGEGLCQVCHLEVLQSPEHLDPAEPDEEQLLRDLTGGPGGRGDHVRLACQAVVRADVTVFKRGVRKAKNVG
ncbi:2Fe-2S iron-sulfur cluster-binding protein [Mycolicibacterium brumae]|uniref:(2Fe-2S)-binding protein n=1 Tax=Mycolicibacterium brumae TaxID=85968 RepID=A0A2G5PHL2_9MYCO|nr:2Fe-2S iron-sulfur cluster-binding protein [Mycolicibacterium brumae]MCV7194487.1 (2Fe-2S)-binding protein [Mycolicibacterium brumae]PIB77777.1 (2Fe-2S)-binding protein [Mycolicibacterium brumae]UWW10022.1 (2Fe-2S)-binding protein [Mycolicibacterium brumae]